MSEIAIRAEGVSKRYHIKSAEDLQVGSRLRDALSEGMKYWAKRLLRPLGKSTARGPSVREFWALSDVSFEIERGDVVGLVGSNGAGKSTLLKVISRITAPTRGWLSVRGRVVSLLEVGTGFNADLTGRENVFLNGAIIGMKRAEVRKKFDEIVGFAEVENFIDMPVRFYSSGMYARLAFAVAVHQEPEILILDEVLAVGDAQFQKKCMEKMHRVAREGHTVLFVSHNAASVQTFCRKAILLAGGRVMAFGDTAQVMTTYLRHTADAEQPALSAGAA